LQKDLQNPAGGVMALVLEPSSFDDGGLQQKNLDPAKKQSSFEILLKT